MNASDLRNHLPWSTCIAMTTKYEGVHDPRFSLALQTMLMAQHAQYSTVVVDGSDVFMRQLMAQMRINVFPENRSGIGNAWRQAIKQTLQSNGGSEGKIVVLMQPEKYDVIRLISQIVMPLIDGKAEIVIASRTEKSWDTYPIFQKVSERMANDIYRRSLGLDFDPMFGVLAFKARVAKYFLEYDADEFGFPDTYDSYHIPPVLASQDGIGVVGVPVDFEYPSSQRELEENNPAMRQNRIQQRSLMTDIYSQLGSVPFGELEHSL